MTVEIVYIEYRGIMGSAEYGIHFIPYIKRK